VPEVPHQLQLRALQASNGALRQQHSCCATICSEPPNSTHSLRRYLSAPGHNLDVKLLLEAFQMALAAWMLRPEAAMLRAQMVARLLSFPESPYLASWLTAQHADAAEQQQQQQRQQQEEGHVGDPPAVRCLVPSTASLTQAGGLHRMLLRGHTAPLTAMLLTPSGIDLVTGVDFVRLVFPHPSASGAAT